MRWARRGWALPDHVSAAVSGERALAAAAAEDGTWLVGTRDRLHLVGEGADDVLAWEEVHRADWEQETETLTVQRVEPFGAPLTPRAFVLREPGELLSLVRERVTASVVVQRRVPVAGHRGVTVVGRRPPGGAGDTTWAVELDAGLDPDDPVVRATVERGLAEARESLGL